MVTTMIFNFIRLWKNKLIFVLFSFSLVLSAVNFSNFQSLMNDQTSTSDPVAGLEELTFLLYKNKTLQFSVDNQEMSPGLEQWNKFLYDEYFSKNKENIQYDLRYFTELQSALATDRVLLSQQEIQDLKYAIQVYHYIENKKQEDPNYDYIGLSTLLVKGDGILYGFIPMILIVMMIIWLATEEFESKTSVFSRSLPISRTKVILGHFFTGIILFLCYLVFIIFNTGIVCIINNIKTGDFFLPLRSASIVSPQITTLFVLLGIWLIFIIKGAVLLSFGLLLATIVRKAIEASLIVFYSSLILYICTIFFKSFQSNYNIFFYQYYQQILGNRDYYLGENGSSFTTMVDSRMDQSDLLIIAFLLIAFFSFAVAVNSWNRTIEINQNNTLPTILMFKPKHFSVKVEFYKINQYLNPILLWPITILTTIIFLMFMTINDYQAHQDIVDSQDLKGLVQFVDHQNATISELNQLLHENQESPEKVQTLTFLLDNTEIQRNYYQKIVESENIRTQAYLRGDSRSFYNNTDHLYISRYGHYDPELESYKYWKYGFYYDYYQNGRYPTFFGEILSKERITLFLDKGIRPIPNSLFVMTPYDHPMNVRDYMSEAITTQPSDRSFLGQWYRLLMIYRFDLLILLAFVLFCSPGFSVDQEKQGSLKWLFSLPKSRTSWLNDKVISSVLLSCSLLITVLTITFLYGIFSGGFGQINLPVAVYDKVINNPNDISQFNDTYHWESLICLVFQSILYLAASMLFLVNLSIYLSLWINNHIIKSIFVIFICVTGYILELFNTSTLINTILPFAYLNIPFQIDNQIIFSISIMKDSRLFGWIILLVYSFIFYLLSRHRIRRIH